LAKRIKKKESEKLTDSNIEYVISLLQAEKPITKKEACEILRISYNTTRLNNIISQYKEDREYREKRKKEKRGRPADKSEIGFIVEGYLEGNSLVDISRKVYRSVSFVKNVVETVGVPSRVSGAAAHETEYLPDPCVSENFSPGEIAWAANYHKPCEIKEQLPEKYNSLYGTNCYKVWIKEEVTLKDDTQYYMSSSSGGFNAFIPAYDLGKLSHLSEYGVNVDRI
jgi:hypothetical protein